MQKPRPGNRDLPKDRRCAQKKAATIAASKLLPRGLAVL